MQLKKRLLIVIGLILLLGVGGKLYIDNQKIKEQKVEEEKIEAERMSVVALKERYADIKQVEFDKSFYNNKTGAYTMYVKMTNGQSESVIFSYTFWEKQKEVGAADLVDREVQVKGVTTSRVQVIFSNKDEGEV